VSKWLGVQHASSVFTTAITEAEILQGLRLLPPGRRRSDLETAILPIFNEDMSGRVLPFDRDAADVYAISATDRRKAGRPISQFDAQIAAITISRGASLATRIVSDFEGIGLQILNPWEIR
jgi:predicted nucleic acid-binding protein